MLKTLDFHLYFEHNVVLVDVQARSQRGSGIAPPSCWVDLCRGTRTGLFDSLVSKQLSVLPYVPVTIGTSVTPSHIRIPSESTSDLAEPRQAHARARHRQLGPGQPHENVHRGKLSAAHGTQEVKNGIAILVHIEKKCTAFRSRD